MINIHNIKDCAEQNLTPDSLKDLDVFVLLNDPKFATEENFDKANITLTFLVGDRIGWEHQPYWWNPTGERIQKFVDETVMVDYWRSPIPIKQLKLIQPKE